MSNIFLTAVATDYADKKLIDVVKEIKNPEVTAKGQLEAIREAIMLAVMFGFNLVDKKESDEANETDNSG